MSDLPAERAGLLPAKRLKPGSIQPFQKALPVTTSPIFNPPGGAYATSQSVSISSGSDGRDDLLHDQRNDSNNVLDGLQRPDHGERFGKSGSDRRCLRLRSQRVGTAAYSIAPILPAPVLSPSPGIYTTAQTVTISDSIPEPPSITRPTGRRRQSRLTSIARLSP